MLSLPTTVLLVLSFIGTVAVYVIDGIIAKKISRTSADRYFYITAKGLGCGIAVLIFTGGFGTTSAFSLLTGAAFGLICVLQTWSALKAMKCGPFSYTQIIIALSTVIPTFCGLFWGETITFTQYIGIALMLVCIALSTDKGEGEKKANTKWLLISIASSVMVGMMGVMQKIHQTSEHASELPSFLTACFAVWVLFSAIMLAVKVRSKDPEEAKVCFRFSFSHVALLICAGVSLAICHVVNLFLSGVMDAAMLFPIINICPLILTTLAGLMIFREKISAKRWIGIAVGFVSMLFVGGVIAF